MMLTNVQDGGGGGGGGGGAPPALYWKFNSTGNSLFNLLVIEAKCPVLPKAPAPVF